MSLSQCEYFWRIIIIRSYGHSINISALLLFTVDPLWSKFTVNHELLKHYQWKKSSSVLQKKSTGYCKKPKHWHHTENVVCCLMNIYTCLQNPTGISNVPSGKTAAILLLSQIPAMPLSASMDIESQKLQPKRSFSPLKLSLSWNRRDLQIW